MVLSLAKDQLKYGSPELEELSRQVKVGDLSAVLKLYEEDIRSPVKSAITGSLLRSLFIQIQKAKVCMCSNSGLMLLLRQSFF